MFRASQLQFLFKLNVRVGPQTLGSQVKFKVMTTRESSACCGCYKKSEDEFSKMKKYPQNCLKEYSVIFAIE